MGEETESGSATGSGTLKRPRNENDEPGNESNKTKPVGTKTDADTAKKAKTSAVSEMTVSSQKKKRPTYLPDIPLSSAYHISWMHREIITQITHNPKHGYIVSGSQDGVVKFWKRLTIDQENCLPLAMTSQQTQSQQTTQTAQQQQQQPGLEFVKAFTAHTGPVLCLAMQDDWCASIGKEEIQIYSVQMFDSLALIANKPNQNISFSLATWFTLEQQGPALAVSVQENGSIYVYDATVTHAWLPNVVECHGNNPVTAMAYVPPKNAMISADAAGIIEVWDCNSSISGSSNGTVTGMQNSLQAEQLDNGDGDNEKDDKTVVTMQQESIQIGGSLNKNKHGISYSSKLDTDLYNLVKKKTFATSIAVACRNNNHKATFFAIYGNDQRVRIFDFATAKILVTYDERLQTYDKIHMNKPFQLDSLEYGTRAAKERQMMKDEPKIQPPSRVAFDPTGKYILISTIMGIKVIEWHPKPQPNKVIGIIGQEDASQLRFTQICLCPGPPVVDQQMALARKQNTSAKSNMSSSSNNNKTDKDDDNNSGPKSDALLVALANDQRRFYVFSHYNVVTDPRAPDDILTRRDVWNEIPNAEDFVATDGGNIPGSNPTTASLLRGNNTITAILRTTVGDIYLQLFAKQCPRTTENFVGHASSGYYNNVIFHRVLKGFMIQTGDPLGDGTGGESIWGGDFDDEFVAGLRHDRPFTLSMANAGPNTNGSQFFITTVPCPWLDQKHTVFGRVTRGMDVCTLIENAKTDDRDKPFDEISILTIDIEQ